MKVVGFKRWAMVALMTLGGAMGVSTAQAYPDKPITIVVPFSPGSGTDQIARGMAQVLSKGLGNATVVVDNKPGAGGGIAAQTVARAAADGYTLLMTTNTTQSANPHLFKKLAYDPNRDYEPIAAIARGSMLLVVPTSSPANSVAAFLEQAKGKNLSFGAGNSSSRVAAEMLAQMTGNKFLYVPYKSNPQAVTDLIGGQIDFMLADTAVALPLVQSGKLKAIAYAGSNRIKAAPAVPTLAESGVPGYELYYWVGVYAPRSTPAPVVTRLNDALIKAVDDPAVEKIYASAVLDRFTTSPGGLGEFQTSELKKWGQVIRAAGIQPE